MRIGWWLSAAAAALLGFVGVPADAADVNPVRKLVIDFDAGDVPVAQVGVPVTFTSTATFVPNEGGSPWIVHRWDFGDGATAALPRIDGVVGEPIVSEVQNTFLAPGIYTVRCTAFHGQTEIGYRFSKSATKKIAVGCFGDDPGTVECGTPRFTPFTGTWQFTFRDADLDEEDSITFDLVQDGDALTGQVTSSGYADIQVGATITGKASSGASLRAKLGFGTPSVAKPPAMPTLTMTLKRTGARTSYGRGDAILVIRPELGSERLKDRGTFERLTPARSELQLPERVCASLSSGKPVIKPGGSVAFVVAIQAVGPGSTDFAKLALVVEVTGGTIETGTLKVNRLVAVTDGPAAFGAILESLGAGRPADSRAAAAFLVRADDGADQVTCRMLVANEDAEIVDVPRERKICVAVVE